MQTYKKIIFVTLFLCFTNLKIVYAEDVTDKLKNLWDKVSDNSEEIIEWSLDSFSNFTEEVGQAVDAELEYFTSNKTDDNPIELQDKIDSLKIYVEKITDLKKEEEDASSFTLIGKSKKDYRIKIDEVLSEIEIILFDGEVVNYAEKIRKVREQIISLETRKVILNEDLVFASDKKKLLGSSKDDIQTEINEIDRVIKNSFELIDKLEYDLKKKLSFLGIEVTREQIRVMTTRVDGDELAKSFAIFDVTKQISTTLGELVKINSFSASTTVKYYGTYVILTEILAFSQREYIRKIEDVYRPAIKKIEDDVDSSIEFAEDSIKSAKSESNKNILQQNIKSNKFTLKVLKQYDEILEKQKVSLEEASEITKEQITVAYSTYDTAANSANLVSLINETEDSFNKILDMQLPEIIPFENTELELKFQEVSGQIISEIQ
tara:strand:+ start:896 stop:2197 length:1302 start_codon:yes stop_codon:yes gene_type:complete